MVLMKKLHLRNLMITKSPLKEDKMKDNNLWNFLFLMMTSTLSQKKLLNQEWFMIIKLTMEFNNKIWLRIVRPHNRTYKTIRIYLCHSILTYPFKIQLPSWNQRECLIAKKSYNNTLKDSNQSIRLKFAKIGN